MHTLLILLSLALACLGSLACRRLLARARSWDSRRLVQMAGLMLPVVVLTLLGAIMAHFLAQVCFLATPPADAALTTSLVVAGVLSFTGALLGNSLRVVWGSWHIHHHSWPAPAAFQVRVRRRATELGVRRVPSIRVAVDPHPWALVIGLFRPQLVLSTGLLALLDAEELDAVLAHELIHLRRGDVRWTILAGTLQDLGWFLPPARRLYRLLRVEQELACDDALCEEPRRLALASALTRVWQAGVSGAPAPRNALTLLPAGSAGHVEGRVHRLLAAPARPAAVHRWAGTLALGAVVGLVLLLQAGATLWTMTVVGCDLHQMGLVAALMP